MVSSGCMNAMYLGGCDTTTADLTWSSRTEYEIATFIDAAELMRILVESGYNASLGINEDAKTRKKKPYIVTVVQAG